MYLNDSYGQAGADCDTVYTRVCRPIPQSRKRAHFVQTKLPFAACTVIAQGSATPHSSDTGGGAWSGSEPPFALKG
jgi:hypothetical protein